jgi:hypothetical protein
MVISSAQGFHGGKQAKGWAVVGVTARVGLGSQVLGNRHLTGHFCLLGGDNSLLQQPLEMFFRRWGEEFPGDFFAGHFSDNSIGGRRYFLCLFR